MPVDLLIVECQFAYQNRLGRMAMQRGLSYDCMTTPESALIHLEAKPDLPQAYFVSMGPIDDNKGFLQARKVLDYVNRFGYGNLFYFMSEPMLKGFDDDIKVAKAIANFFYKNKDIQVERAVRQVAISIRRK